MEINEATCLCRFGGCEVLRDGAYAKSNYWSATSTAECLDTKSCTHICWHLYRSVEARFSTNAPENMCFAGYHGVVPFMWAWRVGGCENIRRFALPSTACMPLQRKHVAHQKQLDLLCVSVCLSVCGLAACLTPTLIHTHTHALCHVHTTQDPPHTHTHTLVGVVR